MKPPQQSSRLSLTRCACGSCGLCYHDELTNKELAKRLDLEPATTLHHARVLLDTGFLAPCEVRNGRRGALEKPYRSTGKSWTLTVERPDEQGDQRARRDRGPCAPRSSTPGPERHGARTRLGLRLSAEEARELEARIDDFVEELGARAFTAGGNRYGLFVSLLQVDHTEEPPQ